MKNKKAGGSAETRPEPAKKKKTRKTPKVTPRQSKLIEGILEGKSTRKAALEAGYAEHTAAHPDQLLGTEAVRAQLARLLASPAKIAQRINEGLDAMVTEFAKFEGRITDKVECIDFSERRQYAALAARLAGLDPGIKVEQSGAVLNSIKIQFVNVDGISGS